MLVFPGGEIIIHGKAPADRCTIRRREYGMNINKQIKVTRRIMPVAVACFMVLIFSTAAMAVTHKNSEEIKKLDETACSDGFSFVVVADSHVDDAAFGKIVQIASVIKPDFAISVGDSTKNGTQDEYAQFINEISPAGIPWFVVPGNHEYRTPDGHTSADGRQRFEKVFGPSDFTFTHCGWRFIGIDIVAYESLLPGVLAKMEKALKGYEGKAAVFMHYPPSIIKNWEDGYWSANAKEMMALLEKDQVPFFFSGHIHIYDHLKIGPTDYIITGGGSSGVDTDVPKEKYNDPNGGAFTHFILVTVKDDKATYSVVRPNY